MSGRDRDPLKTESESVLLYDWQFTANQFGLGPSSLRLMTTFFFFLQLNPQTIGWVCLLHITRIASYWIFFLLKYIQVICQFRLNKAGHAFLISRMLRRQFSRCNVVSLTTAKLSPLTLSVWLRLVLCCEHDRSHDFIWHLVVASLLLIYNHIHMEGWKPCANRELVCTLENFQGRGEPCFAVAVNSKGGHLTIIPRRVKHKSLLTSLVLYGGLV
jgi:hypothetical protein